MGDADELFRDHSSASGAQQGGAGQVHSVQQQSANAVNAANAAGTGGRPAHFMQPAARCADPAPMRSTSNWSFGYGHVLGCVGM